MCPDVQMHRFGGFDRYSLTVPRRQSQHVPAA